MFHYTLVFIGNYFFISTDGGSHQYGLYLLLMGVRHNLIRSFDYAFQGIFTALKNEPNLRIHFIMGFAALLTGYFLKLNRLEWIILAFTIVFVIVLELINTILESLVDLVSPEFKPAAKVAKDVSASIVLVSAIFSIIVGVLLFGPKLIFFAARLRY